MKYSIIVGEVFVECNIIRRNEEEVGRVPDSLTKRGAFTYFVFGRGMRSCTSG
jgi:hypothetical protein